MTMSDAYTVSVSTDNHAEEHSRRSYVPKSADRGLSQENVIIYDCGDDKTHFNEFFEPSITAYNAKQKRNDRKKDYDYWDALQSGREGYGSGKTQEKCVYHDVIQIGNRDANGITDDSFDVEHWRKLKEDGKMQEATDYVMQHKNTSKVNEDIKECLVQIAKEIKENKDGKYDGILVHGLIIHADEPNGTVHLDFRYSVYTEGEKTGLGTRISLNKGLGKLGYKTDNNSTNLNKFRDSIKDRIEEIMLEKNLQREKKNEHRAHLSVREYELKQETEKLEKELKKATQDYTKIITDGIVEKVSMDNQKKAFEKEMSLKKKKIEETEQELSKREEEIQTEKQELEIFRNELNLREESIEEKEKKQQEKEQEFQHREDKLEAQKLAVEKEKETVALELNVARETTQNAKETKVSYLKMIEEADRVLQPYTIDELKRTLLKEFKEKAEQRKNNSGKTLWSMVGKTFTQVVNALGENKIEKSRYPVERMKMSLDNQQMNQDFREKQIDAAFDYFDRKDKKRNDDFEL